MNRLVSLLLIPVLMLGSMPPHSHAGRGDVDPVGHSLRSHIHLAGDHHHAHDGDDHEHHHHDREQGFANSSECAKATTSATLSTPPEHDSDAIYFAKTDGTAIRTNALSQQDLTPLVWTSTHSPVERDAGWQCGTFDPPDRHAGLPVYLLIASLRL